MTVKCAALENNTLTIIVNLAPVIQRLDDTIHCANYSTIQWTSVNKTNHTIRRIVIYPVGSVIHFLNNPALNCSISCPAGQHASHSAKGKKNCIEAHSRLILGQEYCLTNISRNPSLDWWQQRCSMVANS